MPKNVPAELEEKFASCKEKVMAQGNDEEAAYGICYMSVVEGKSLEDATKFYMDGVKVGARNSVADKQRLQAAHDALVEAGAECESMKAITDETPAFIGDAVKALDDNGRVGGYLVRFTNENEPDLTGDFFTAKTDFGESDKLPVLYHHGFDKSIGKRKIGTANLRRDEIGLWAEAQLQMRDEYEKKVFELARAGKLGWSSGAASHAVERESTSKAAWVKQWYLAEASLTPTPAEYRNLVTSVKALTQGAGAREETDAVTNEQNIIPMEGNKMSEENKPIDVAEIARAAAAEAVKAFADSLPEVKTGFNVQVTKDEADKPFGNLAEQMQAVKAFDQSNGRVEDPRLKRLAAKAPLGLNEGVPSQGGFLLEPTISAEFLKPIHEEGVFSRMVRRLPVGANSNFGWINGVDETSRATGSRFGGVQAYWRPEAGSVTASKPKFRRINWELKSLEALMYITDEQLADASMTAEIARQSAGEELMFMVNDAILNGDGVGKPLGALNSNALISVTRTDANTILNADLLNMWQRLHPARRANAAWFVNSEAEPKLDQLYLTSSLEARYVTYGADSVMRIKGKPVYVTEFNAGLGAVGDIVLADFSDYLMWEKGGIQSSVNPWIQWLTGEQAFKFTYRVDGQPATYSAVTPYKGSNTQSPYVALSASS